MTYAPAGTIAHCQNTLRAWVMLILRIDFYILTRTDFNFSHCILHFIIYVLFVVCRPQINKYYYYYYYFYPVSVIHTSVGSPEPVQTSVYDQVHPAGPHQRTSWGHRMTVSRCSRWPACAMESRSRAATLRHITLHTGAAPVLVAPAPFMVPSLYMCLKTVS